MDRTKQEELGAIVTRFETAKGVLEKMAEHLSGSSEMDNINIPRSDFSVEEYQLTFPFLGNRVVIKRDIAEDSKGSIIAVVVWRIYDPTTARYRDEEVVQAAEEIYSLENPDAPVLERQDIRMLCVEKLFDLIDRNAKNGPSRVGAYAPAT